MKTLLFFLLFSVGAQAQGSFSPSIPAKQFQSYADVNLFLSTTGNDANACTASGTSACLTFKGVVGKFPKRPRHLVKVSVSAGNYAGASIPGFTLDPSYQQSTAGIWIDGALANLTPATGTATGTATSGTAGSGITFGTLADTLQTWTINDPAIVGKLVTIVSGTGSGQTRNVISNTATVLTIAGSWTAPDATSVYALQSPSVHITSAAPAIPTAAGGTGTAAAGLQILDNGSGSAGILIRNIDISIAATPAVISNSPALALTNVTTSSTTAFSGISQTGGSLTLTGCTVLATSGRGVQASAGAQLTISNSFVSQTSSNGVGVFSGSSASITGSQITATNPVLVQTLATSSLNTVRLDCLSSATSAGMTAGVQASLIVNPSRPGYITVNGNVDITNCTYGMLAVDSSTITVSNTIVISGNALTYGANAVRGGSISLPTAVATLTGVTAQMSVDTGALTGTWASLASSNACLISTTGTVSRVCRL